MLTTGIPLPAPAKQRAFVKRLASHNLAGLGFGTGFGHRKLPEGAGRRGGASRISRCSRSPTRCRSSRSPRRRSRAWSTSSTRCCSAALAVQRAPRAAGPRRARPRRDRGDDLLGGRRHGDDLRRPRRAHRLPRLPPRALRGASTAIRRRSGPAASEGHPFAPGHAVGGRPRARPAGDRAGRRPAAGLGRDGRRLRRARRLRAADPPAGGRDRRRWS